ncbi:hypothetical protein GUITHDRAFT_104049 [Guillardia theta CCMP2712]|uniref:RWD domain-containing protein n=1 Tax=Guillardia theta (strain CCMP2712) TaxID=905079 RepID=L1JPW9_GUITC|nr:hypothetical protein GUITHDRAFT_104049 [Guillardia theta CCMP2712]EKX50235.1 hypothetical protein GUITHDRAFT_104049 [Guillardia theta CCMP2712]|eukprot:XP_005837215.1 hypothetical protein GUITHDRAFT_104049 [Guillardia theta CCMP2712]
MEHATEQADEVEALESIYCGFFDMLSQGAPYKVSRLFPSSPNPCIDSSSPDLVPVPVPVPVPVSFRVAVDPEAAQEREGNSAQPVRLEITFPEKYPEEAPEIEVRYSHILPKHAAALKASCSYCCRGSSVTAQDWGAYEEEEEEDESKKRNKARVWKDITAGLKEKLLRPTGRQLFERDASLYMDTDVGFNDATLFEDEEFPEDEEDEEDEEEFDDEDEDEGAGIDESLFQTLDDELPDSDSDDPDFEPGK